MRPIIFQVHFHGIYYAGDHIDIHDNTSVNFYQGENTKETNTTRRMGYTRIETERAGRRACAKARATTGTALVKHYALRYAFPKIKIIWGPHCTNSGGRDGRTTARTWREYRRRGNPPTPQAPTLQAGTNKITAYDAGLTNEEKGEIKTIFFLSQNKIFAKREK